MIMDKVYIKSLVQNVINKEFSNQHKRRIDEYADRLNLACPYCGDSSKSVYKKRGNLYFNKLFYICFNCDKKTSLDKLARDFNEKFPGFETDIHGLVKADLDGRSEYYVDCVRQERDITP